MGSGAGGWYIPRLGFQHGSSCAGEPRPSVAIPFHSLVETGWLSLPGSVLSQPRERKPFINYNNRSTWTGVGGGHTLGAAEEGRPRLAASYRLYSHTFHHLRGARPLWHTSCQHHCFGALWPFLTQ